MVRAIIAGTKNQTRRLVTRRNSLVDGASASAALWGELDFGSPDVRMDPGPSPAGNPGQYLKVPRRGWDTVHRVYPRVQPGDRLWVRETYCVEHQVEHDQPPPFDDGRPIQRGDDGWRQPHYRATDPTPELAYEYAPDADGEPTVKWRPSIFMPRWASRLTLTVPVVRVERLQDISAMDIIAEGAVERAHVDQFGRNPVSAFDGKVYLDLKSLWGCGWEKINGHGSWAANPLVWIYDFARQP